VQFGDDYVRARSGHVAHNFAVERHIAFNLLRLGNAPKKTSLKNRRILAALPTSSGPTCSASRSRRRTTKRSTIDDKCVAAGALAMLRTLVQGRGSSTVPCGAGTGISNLAPNSSVCLSISP